VVDAHAGNAEALRVAAVAGIDVLQHPEDAGGYRMSETLARALIERGVVCSLLPREITGEGWKRFQEHVALGGRMWPAEMPPDRMRARQDSLRAAGASLDVPRSPSVVRWQNRRANAELLIRAGCVVSVATDALVGGRPMGERTWEAIEGLVELGMTPMQAIVAATRNGARAAGKIREIGTIEIGKRADLVILRDNPLSDIRNIRTIDAVIVGGRQ
jgi:imidazolonepropionase-like amidohydrolase